MVSGDSILPTESESTISRLAVLSSRLSVILPAYLLLGLVVGMILDAVPSRLNWISQGVFWMMAAIGVVAVLSVPVGFVTGIIALIQIRRSGGRLGGRHLAITGITVTALTGIVLYLGYLVLLHSHDRAQEASCRSNLKQIGLAVEMYEEDYDGLFPSPEKWNDALYPYTKSRYILACPSAEGGGKASYAMNIMLKGKHIKDLKDPHNTVVIFDSVPGNNLSGGPDLLQIKPRHHEYNILFADGSVRRYSPETIRKVTTWRYE